MPGVQRMPSAPEINLKPSTKIHRVGIAWHAYIAKVAGAIAGRDVEAPTKGNSQMGIITTNTHAFLMRVPSRAISSGIRITELNSVMGVLQYSLNARPSFLVSTERGPGDAVQLLRIAVPATQKVN